MKLKLLLTLALLFPAAAAAQVKQSGTPTQRHFTCWTTNGVVQDCGTAAAPFATSIGTVGQGPTICANSAAVTGPYNRLCMGANTASAAQISLDTFGGAAAQDLQLCNNGACFTVPTSVAGTLITGTPPFSVNDIPVFSTTGGTIVDSGVSAASGIITSGQWGGTVIPVLKGGTGGTTAALARTNLGLGSMATQDAAAVAITGGAITGLPSPTLSADAATKGYVDATSAGLRIQPPSRLATAAVLPNTPTYSNGTAGVGATLTAGGNAALVVDATATVLNNVVLVKDQVSTTGCTVANAGCQNGIYTVTTVGDGSTPWVLTRATYFDTAAEMLAGSYTSVTAGATNIGNSYVLQSTVTTVGTTPATFYLFSSTAAAVTSIAGQTGAFTCGTPMNCTSNNITVANGGITNTQVNTSAAIVSTKLQNTVTTGGSPVARTIQSKLNDVYISILDYGAVGNGTTDDTAAIQAAVNAAGAAQGQVAIWVPFTANCYKTTASITWTPTVGDINGRSLFIKGFGGTGSNICNQATTAIPTFSFGAPSYGAQYSGVTLQMEDIYFSTPTHATIGNAAIALNGLSDAILNRVWVYGNYDGIQLVGSFAPTITNGNFRYMACAAIRADSDASFNNALIFRNYIMGSGNTGDCAVIDYLDGNQAVISTNDLEGNRAGIRSRGTSLGVSLYGNFIEVSALYPFTCDTLCTYWDIRSNWFANNGSGSIGVIKNSYFGYNSTLNQTITVSSSNNTEFDFGPNSGVTISGSTGWKTFAFANGWTNQGGAVATFGYRMKSGGEVELRGTVTGGTLNSVIGTITPSSYCPTGGHRIFPAVSDGSTFASVEIKTDCTISVLVSTLNVSLDGVRFTP